MSSATFEQTVYYRDLVNSLPNALLVIDAAMTVHYANLGFYELVGAREDTTFRATLTDVMPDLALDPKLCALLSAVAEHDVTIERYVVQQEFPILGRRMLEISASRIKRDGIAINRAIIRIEDVTEDALTQEKKAREAETSRNQVVEINHRVKNNLASILSMLRLESRGVEAKASRDILERISARVEQIARLYELLAVSGADGQVRLRTYFEAVCESIAIVTGAEAQNWSISVAGDNPSVSVDDAISIGAVVNELTVNAGKYAFVAQTTPGLVEVSCQDLGGALQIEVRDNGTGLDDANREPKSTGLGMKLVEVYLANLGGRLEQHSVTGNGTVNIITVPRKPKTEGVAAIAAKDVSGALRSAEVVALGGHRAT
ncbi:MAG: histidine kinase dimerization/phosphoacceptor domain -containing protein [Pseudomonadota bacterium]